MNFTYCIFSLISSSPHPYSVPDFDLHSCFVATHVLSICNWSLWWNRLLRVFSCWKGSIKGKKKWKLYLKLNQRWGNDPFRLRSKKTKKISLTWRRYTQPDVQSANSGILQINLGAFSFIIWLIFTGIESSSRSTLCRCMEICYKWKWRSDIQLWCTWCIWLTKQLHQTNQNHHTDRIVR